MAGGKGLAQGFPRGETAAADPQPAEEQTHMTSGDTLLPL